MAKMTDYYLPTKIHKWSFSLSFFEMRKNDDE